MVNYDNPDLFYDHDETHLIIVNAGATVTGVSNDEPTITDADFIITEEDITDDEIEVRECLCGADNLKFGTLESSCFRVSIFDSDSIPYLKDEEIKVYIYFDGDSSTLFQIGRYIVREDKYSDDRSIRDLTAYDIIQYLRDYDITEWYNEVYKDSEVRSIKHLRDSLFAWLNQDIEDYNITQEETNLVNDTWLVEKSIESDVVTFGFFMQGIAEFNGVFPHIDRQGVFRYIQMQWYDKPAVKTFDEEQIFPPIQYGGNDKEITVWGIGYVIVYDRNNTRIAKVGSTNKKHPSNYTIIDSFVITNNLKRFGWKDSLKTALANLREVITHLRYKPFEGDFEGNLCLEVGDRIDVQLEDYDEETDYTDDEVPIIKTFYSYILERTCRGLQEFEDNYIARGDKKQPRYKITNDKWHQGDSSIGYSGDGSGGISLVHDDFDEELIEKDRNKGFRYLDEPNIIDAQYDSDTGKFKVKWEDPIDLTNNKPVQCIWAKTYVVMSDAEKPPKNIYQGTIVETSTTRDEYKTNWFEVTVEKNKRYYFAFMPEDTKEDVRWTKVISLDTSEYVLAPTITSIEMGGAETWDGSEVAILWSGNTNKLTVSWDNSRLYFKLYKGSTVIYSWDISASDKDAIQNLVHVGFLKDDADYIAKPSFVYETAQGVYSYNQESPTSAEMDAIYLWLMLQVSKVISASVTANSFVSSYNGETVFTNMATSYPDVVQYINTQYCFTIGQRNKKALTAEDGAFKYSNSGGYTGSMTFIPIGAYRRIKNIKFKYKKPSTTDYYYCNVYLCNTTQAGANTVYNVLINTSGTVSNWTDVNVDCDFVANYIVVLGFNGIVYIKDIEITYE